jgi:hypothetical protein
LSKIDLYEGIKADLENVTYVDSKGVVQKVRTVGLWRNQLIREKVEKALILPAVYIEFLPSNYMEGSSKVYQTLNMTVRLHVCFHSIKDDDMDILRLTQAVYSAMQLKQYGYFGLLKRRNEEQDFDHDNVQDFIQDYDAGQAKTLHTISAQQRTQQ